MAEYSSVWDVDLHGRGYIITTPCTIDFEKKNGELEIDTASSDESESVEMLDREYVQIKGSEKEFPAIGGYITSGILLEIKQIIKNSL